MLTISVVSQISILVQKFLILRLIANVDNYLERKIEKKISINIFKLKFNKIGSMKGFFKIEMAKQLLSCLPNQQQILIKNVLNPRVKALIH